MNTHSASDVVAAALALSETVGTELVELGGLRQKNAACLQETIRLRHEAGVALGKALLPELTPAALAEAGRFFGGAFFGPVDPIAEMEAERRECTEELSGIEGDPCYTDRESLLAQFRSQRQEWTERSAPDRSLLARAQHPRLDRLIEAGYDTPAYPVGWWHLEYYDDWKAGDEVVEQFPGQERFAPIAEQVLAARKRNLEADEHLGDLDQKIGEVEELVRRAEDLRQYLGNLGEIHLERARERLRAHLLEGDPVALLDRLSADAGLAETFKTLRGLAAKALYLEGIDAELRQAEAQCSELRGKALHDVTKWQRPKRSGETLAEADFQRRYLTPRERLRLRRERYAQMSLLVWGYQDYGGVGFTDDFLWWDQFTGGQYDGAFIPEVSAYRQHHPGSFPHHRSDGAEADAAASEAGMLSDRDDGRSFVDPS